MNISDAKPFKSATPDESATLSPNQASPAVPASKLPIQADQYKGSIPDHHLVRGADLSTYKKVFGALGAANMAFASHFLMPVGFGALGVSLGETIGTLVGGPLGGIIGKIAGGLAGVYSGFKIQNKTLIGRKTGGRIGGALGEMMGLFAKALRIPLRSDHIEETKNYSYKGMKSLLGTTTHTNHLHLGDKEIDEFIAKLRPGDLVLTNDEACTIFSLLIVAVDGKADFNHAILYTGDGKTIESRTITHGVAEGVLKDVLQHKHHAVAIRPRYDPPETQAEAVVKSGKDMIGTKYDYKFGMGDNAMYCSEVVYKAVKKGAPQIEFKKRPLITKEVVLPGDLLRTKQADVIAEVGRDNTLFNSYLAKFI